MRMRKKLALLLTSAVVSTSFINNQFALYQNVSYGVTIEQSYNSEDQINILSELKGKLEGPKILSINVKSDQPVYIIGDIHADYASFDIVRKIIKQNPNAIVVFLGDYVDRGAHSVEVLMGIARLKINNPEHIVLLPGNHERDYEKIFDSFIHKFHSLYDAPDRRESFKPAPIKKGNCLAEGLTTIWGLVKEFFQPVEQQKVKIDEIAEQPTSKTDELIAKYKEIFEALPLGVILNLSNSKKIFCTHGGVPVDNSDSPIILDPEKELDGNVIQQLLWNDPKKYITGTTNTNRGDTLCLPYAKFYSSDIAANFLQRNNFSAMFRAHEPVRDGFRRDFDNVPHYTVFSSANHKKADQKASIVKINSNHENFNVIIFGGEKYNLSMGNNIPDYEQLDTKKNIKI